MRIIDGHPVPYSLTVMPQGEREPNEDEVREAAATWLAEYKPQMRVLRVEDNYAFYGPANA